MQMLKAPELIRDPNILRKLLASKYFFCLEDYLISITDIFLFRKRSKIYSIYNDVILLSDPCDYLKRAYSRQETKERIPKLTEYYSTYQMFFCRPIVNNWLNCFLLKKHFDRKAEVFYMNNYYSKNDGIVSLERNAYLDDESSMTNNLTNTRTIFNTKIKEQINSVKDIDFNDKNPINNINNYNVLISTISFENNNLNTLNSSYDLYSKKSPTESLGNIVQAFKQGPPVITKKIIQFNKKIAKPLSCSKDKDKDKDKNKVKEKDNDTAKDKDKEKEKEKDQDKSSSKQHYKPYLHNFRSNLIEFTQNKPPLFISSKSQSKRNVLVKTSRNNQNISSFINKPKDNKTYDSKYAQTAKQNKPTMKQNQTHFNKDKMKQTRNSHISISSITNIFNISQKSLNAKYINTKTTNQKSLSTCNSLININKRKEVIIQKPKLFIQATSNLKDAGAVSRNNKKELYSQSIIMKNMTTLLYKDRKKPKGKGVAIKANNNIYNNKQTHKITKSVDEKETTVQSSFSPCAHYKYSIREISKNKKKKCPMTLKISNQLNDLLKYSKKTAKPSLVRYNNSNF